MFRLFAILTFLVLTIPAQAQTSLAPIQSFAQIPVTSVDADMALSLPQLELARVAINFDPDTQNRLAEAVRAEALKNFWVYISVLVIVYLLGSFLLGRMVERRGWKVGYTRKTLALTLYMLPYFAMSGPSPYSPTATASISLTVFTLLLAVQAAPIRRRVPIIATMFASIDRPEDRPFTLWWLITATLATWAVVYAWFLWSPETTGYLFIALFISGVGDALAEPVGLYFGKNTYRTRALGTKKRYIRTLEGSAAVFLSGVFAVLWVHGFSLDATALAALILFPLVGTLAEAKSPHTWDQPFIIGSCALVAVFLSAANGDTL